MLCHRKAKKDVKTLRVRRKAIIKLQGRPNLRCPVILSDEMFCKDVIKVSTSTAGTQIESAFDWNYPSTEF